MSKNIAIAGAGTMGSSMAQIFAKYGFKVFVYDVAIAAIERSKKNIQAGLSTEIAQGAMTQKQAMEASARISYSTELKDVFPQADYVIESILEDISVKHTFWETVSSMVSDNTILASNTSGLSISTIAAAVKNPERFCGMHWFNPPHLTPLVEVISGEKTAEGTAKAVYDLALSIGRKPILVHKDPCGFCVNRIQFAVFREAINIVRNGYASMEDVDTALRYGLGMRYAVIGIFQMADLGGLDVWRTISTYLFPDLCDAKEVDPMLEDLFERGDFGVKSGKGFFDYTGGKDVELIEYRDKKLLELSKCLLGN